MKNKFLILAAAALALAACAKQEQDPVKEVNNEPMAVGFDAYVNRGVTKAGYTGDITTAVLGGNAAKGFGVFAYYTNDGLYDDTATPNFMYNQLVEQKGTAWTYSPVKYWPNEYKDNAFSEEEDRVTFFAYAPYVSVVPHTGKIDGATEEQTWGITGLPRNTTPNDPLVKYIVSFDSAKSVDLLWAVSDIGYSSWTWKGTNGSSQVFNQGMPYLNVMRPLSTATDQAIKFNFKHATSRLNVQIAYSADVADHSKTSETIKADETKIYVRSITFTGMATKGALNLNNTTPNKALWMDYAGTNDLEHGESVTIYDGRKDGKEGVAGSIAANEKLTGLNTTLVQDENKYAGVTGTLQNLFIGSAATTPIFIIPTGEEVDIEIVYDVETKDKNLSTYLSDGVTHGSSIENRIYKKAVLGASTGFENGKAYLINIYLGMNSVKFDAKVTDWPTSVDTDVDLPANTNPAP